VAVVRAGSEDSELVSGLLQGDEAAFNCLVDRYASSLFRLALSFVPTRAVAEEVVQETWVAIIEGLPWFERRASLKTWMFRILANRAKTRGIRERRSVPFSGLESDGEVEAAIPAGRFRESGRWRTPPQRWESNTPERLLSSREAMGRLHAALNALPQGQRAVITLRDIDGLTSEEVCGILDLSESNQRVLLHRARAKVRAALEEYVDGS
jgi:RNA polymerase sigma-70 factor, ECF subfamily